MGIRLVNFNILLNYFYLVERVVFFGRFGSQHVFGLQKAFSECGNHIKLLK